MSNCPFLFFLLLSLTACNLDSQQLSHQQEFFQDNYKTIGEIPLPEGYERMRIPDHSFGKWLRKQGLKKDNHVYLYNGRLKENQEAQFAVLDIPVGEKDLQQCADAVMRLRAEYLFSEQRFDKIEFFDYDGKSYRWTGQNDRRQFEKYLERVFGMCGTASLEKQLKGRRRIKDIQSGDVFIKGGFPGHAMIVVDVAVNEQGEKIFMLAQSYMPAQDIHIVKNPAAVNLSPWYTTRGVKKLVTPEWVFETDQLKIW